MFARLFSKSKLKTFLLTIVLLALSPTAANSQVCGDVNGDSVAANLLDFYHLLDYFFDGGPPPVNMATADFDGFEKLTPHETNYLIGRICCGGPPPNCPPSKPALQVNPDSAYLISHSKWIEANVTEATVTVEFFTDTSIWYLILPFEIHVGNDIPQIDTVMIESDSTIKLAAYGFSIDSAGGRVLVWFQTAIGAFIVGNSTITLTLPISINESTERREVSIDWTRLPPKQAPQPDSSVIPMVGQYGTAFEPIMICCMGTHGDFNEDGEDGNVLDLTHLVDYIFRGSGDAGSCPEETDLNEDGVSSNTLDLTTLVDYIFRSGAALPSCYF